MSPTYNELYFSIRNTLRAADVSSPELEARLIAEKASGKTREEYIRDGYLPAPMEVIAFAEGCAERRLLGEPVAHITGEWEFYSLPFYVDRGTLIPRTDSEALVSRAVELLRGASKPRVLDLCAGSGCLGIAVSKNVCGTSLTLADISPAALEICEKNAERNGVDATLAALNALEPPPAGCEFDMILCNPPYIPSGDFDALDSSVRDFEPRIALDGGKDGLDFYRAVAPNWKKALRDGGYLLFECGIGQSEAVRGILESEGYSNIKITDDTAGIPRVTEAEK
ncbi:MAG: peptide chain release factor N(5)-glutamine methyltransferase [Clostridiales bacterium]|nr:peptide chain release factor N(5)-glutamine methyltransferase [Clostridiales bacterium]